MPPTKAAKKAANKASGENEQHKAAKDARRTFEHSGRVQAISSLSQAQNESLAQLADLSDRAFHARQYKESADLLRAAEHLSFAAIHADAKETVSQELHETILEEVRHLLEHAEERQSKHPVPEQIGLLVKRVRHDAEQALGRGSYRAALEFARGAEALTHIHEAGAQSLKAPAEQPRLQS